MPELPEVETLRRLLALRLSGARVCDVVLIHPGILRGTEPTAFTAAIMGAIFTGVGRRGKYLLLPLERPPAGDAGMACSEALELVVHLKMRGALRIEASDQPPDRYLCAALELNTGCALRFYDMWRWGEWTLLPAGTAAAQLSGLAAMGPEPLEPHFTSYYLQQRLAGRRGLLKPLLLGQRIVAGLGNIYCDESLHRARLHPARPARSLRPEEIRCLHRAIVSVLSEAVAQGAAHADALAARQANLDDYDGIYVPQIYDRPGQPCPACGQALIKFHLNGRGTTICPHCQPDADVPVGCEAESEGRAERSGSYYV